MAGRSRTTARIARRTVVALVIALVVPTHARADGRVQFLAERLKYPPTAGQRDDFRVRTNAALALGATADEEAVAPLCGGLADPSELVRQAAAVALKRVARGSSLDCLQRHLGVETNESVKLQIQRAIEAIAAAAASNNGGLSGSTSEPSYVANAKYYVSISPVVNNTTRAHAEIERTVRGAIISKLGELGAYQIAPAGESNDSAKMVMAKRKLKGFYLAISLDRLDYSEDSLRVRVKIAVFSYPGKDLRGEVPAGATLPGARPGDRGAEDQLIGLVATRGAELFAQNFR
jgi:hypothetical protein